MATSDPSHLIELHPVSDALHKLYLDSLLQDARRTAESLEQLVYARKYHDISTVLNLLRIHKIASIPIFDEEQDKFISIVNVVNIMRFLMLKEVFNDLEKLEHDQTVRQRVDDLFALPISEVINAMGRREFKAYHKSQSLADGLRAMATKENVYAILVSVSEDQANAASDIKQAAILTQWDAINFLLNSTFVKKHGVLDYPASKVMQRSWITFTEKDDPNQPSHRLPVTPIKSTFGLSITEDMTTLAGFKFMAIHNLSSVAIVNKGEGILIDNLSASDIRYLNKDNISDSLKNVTDFLHKVGCHPKRIVTCEEDTRLGEIMSIAANSNVHRVWVKDKTSGKPIGVVSMSDMLGMVIGGSEISL